MTTQHATLAIEAPDQRGWTQRVGRGDMSEEEQGPIYADNTRYPSEVRLLYPFIVTDAALQAFLAEQEKELRFCSRY